MSPNMWKDSLKALHTHTYAGLTSGYDHVLAEMHRGGEVNIGHIGREAVLGGPVLRQPCGTDGRGAVQPGAVSSVGWGRRDSVLDYHKSSHLFWQFQVFSALESRKSR